MIEFLELVEVQDLSMMYKILTEKWSCDLNQWLAMQNHQWNEKLFVYAFDHYDWCYLVIVDGVPLGCIVMMYESHEGENKPFIHFWNAPGVSGRTVFRVGKEFIRRALLVYPQIYVYNITSEKHHKLYRLLGAQESEEIPGLFTWATRFQQSSASTN